MEELTAHSVEDFLNITAERQPTPGGGSATGLAGALACALARMVAAYSVGKKTDNQVRSAVETAATRLNRADQLLRALITQDAAAYAAMTAAAKSAKDDSAAQLAYDDTVMSAVAVPMEMAALASQALSTMDKLKTDANHFLLSDLGIAAVLADATAHAARYTVKINVAEIRDPETCQKLLTELDTIVEHCADHRRSIETLVNEQLEKTH